MNDTSFLIADSMTGAGDDQEDLILWKGRKLVDDYDWAFRRHPLDVASVVELGIWKGGSVAFFAEVLKPDKLLAFDIRTTGDPIALRRFRSDHPEVVTHWGVDQADSSALREALRAEAIDQIDVVIDDASHLYGPSLASFEVLFPMLPEGGLYILEDWAWPFWPNRAEDEFFRRQEPFTHLVRDVLGVVGSAPDVIHSVSVRQTMVIVERGATEIPIGTKLSSMIYRRPGYRAPAVRYFLRRIINKIRRAVSR